MFCFFPQSCQNPDNGIIGKCCRDPNYTDPWPTGNLPANYSGGFDEQGFPTFLNIAKAKPFDSPQSKTSKTIIKYHPMEQRSNKMEQKFEPMLVPENSDIFTKTLIPPIVDQNEKNAFNAIQRKVRCGIRNKVRYLYNLKIIRINTINIFIRSSRYRSRSFFDFFRSNKTSDNSSRKTLDHRAFFFFFQTVVLSILLRFSLIARIFHDPSLRRKNETKLDFRVPRRFTAGKKSRGWNAGPIG